MTTLGSRHNEWKLHLSIVNVPFQELLYKLHHKTRNEAQCTYERRNRCMFCTIFIYIILTLMDTFRFLILATAFNRKLPCCSLKKTFWLKETCWTSPKTCDLRNYITNYFFLTKTNCVELMCVSGILSSYLCYGDLVLGSSQFQVMTELPQNLLLTFKSGQVIIYQDSV